MELYIDTHANPNHLFKTPLSHRHHMRHKYHPLNPNLFDIPNPVTGLNNNKLTLHNQPQDVKKANDYDELLDNNYIDMDAINEISPVPILKNETKCIIKLIKKKISQNTYICNDYIGLNKHLNKTLDVCLVSYGGSASNTLIKALEYLGLRCRTEEWSKYVCHCSVFLKLNIPIIYIYDDPIKSFLSMKRRGIYIWGMNQIKLNNNHNIKLSDETLLRAMIRQFYTYTRHGQDNNVFIIKSKDIFNSTCIPILEKIFEQKLQRENIQQSFPLKYITPKTNITNLTETEQNLFEKYKK